MKLYRTSNQQMNQSYDIHPVIQQTCLSDSTNPSNLPFQERCSLKVSSHEG